MSTEPSVSTPNVNPLSDIDVDVSDANGWYRYVADSLMLTGQSPRTGETYAREIRILVHRFGKPPFMLAEGQVRTFILVIASPSHRLVSRQTELQSGNPVTHLA